MASISILRTRSNTDELSTLFFMTTSNSQLQLVTCRRNSQPLFFRFCARSTNKQPNKKKTKEQQQQQNDPAEQTFRKVILHEIVLPSFK